MSNKNTSQICISWYLGKSHRTHSIGALHSLLSKVNTNTILVSLMCAKVYFLRLKLDAMNAFKLFLVYVITHFKINTNMSIHFASKWFCSQNICGDGLYSPYTCIYSIVLLESQFHHGNLSYHQYPTVDLPNLSSLYYTLHIERPNYKSLKVFGCLCFLFFKPYNQHKIQF